MPRNKNANIMALAIMSLLDERPMHPYEIASLMKKRGITYSIKLNTGNLYATINSLLSEGLITVKETEREGNLPERTVYELTPAGVESCRAFLREILRKPEKEYPRFTAGLSFIAHLAPKEVAVLLADRVVELKRRAEREHAETESARAEGIDELFLIETRYSYRMLEAELKWVEELQGALASGSLTIHTKKGIQWRAIADVRDEDYKSRESKWQTKGG